MDIETTKRFVKSYDKAPEKVRRAVIKRMSLLSQFPHHPLLRVHKLSGKYQGYKSINITGDWRAVFREDKLNNTIIFEVLGTHSQLYN